jgi:murein DD-endopeptidase MepM/ murein hydrolase activator NlpD
VRFPLPRGPLEPAADVLHGWRVTSYFGSRPHPVTGRPSNHGGMDLAYRGCGGQPILAPVPGRVTQSWDPSGGGWWTSLHGDDGSYWGFGHASKFEPGVNGTHVEAGATLAYVGTSGGSTGDHLHVGYRPRGATRYQDPLDLLVAAAAAETTPDPTEKDDLMAAADDILTRINDLESQIAEWEGHTRDRIGYRAVTVQGRPEVWIVTTAADGSLRRWHVPNEPTLAALRHAGVVAAVPTERLPLFEQGEIDAFLAIPAAAP